MPTHRRIRIDYRDPRPATLARPRPPLRHARWLILATAFAALGAVMAKTNSPESPQATREVQRVGAMQRRALTLPPPTLDAVAAQANTAVADLEWQTIAVESGDSLARLLRNEDVPPGTVHRLVSTSEHGQALSDLRPGERIRLGRDDTGRLVELIHEVAEHRRVHYRRDSGGFSSETTVDALERRLAHASGTIHQSLVAAGKRAGVSTSTTLALADIFAWDIDFALDLRRGDRFHVIYETFYRDGEHVRDGDIVAAEFVNDGRRHRAVRYTDPEGNTDYFAPDGTAIRRPFLRSPMEYSRVTSGFGRRHHPVLHEMREHNGTDYGARPGTPIRATGDGRIVTRGWKGGYGRTVVIRHRERYTTLYAHMSRFEPGQRVGSRVEQGETIGYVGSSGRSTGPHLHYEFLVDGVHRNPQTVELPKGEPVVGAYRPHFASSVLPLVAKLDTLRRTHVVAQR